MKKIKNLFHRDHRRHGHGVSELNGTTAGDLVPASIEAPSPKLHAAPPPLMTGTSPTSPPAQETQAIKERREVRQLEPIVQETVKPVTVEHVQPVIDVHREQTEIHRVIQPIHIVEEKPAQLHRQISPTGIVQGSIPVGG